MFAVGLWHSLSMRCLLQLLTTDGSSLQLRRAFLRSTVYPGPLHPLRIPLALYSVMLELMAPATVNMLVQKCAIAAGMAAILCLDLRAAHCHA